MRASQRTTGRPVTRAMLSARLAGHVALEARPNGEVVARFYGHSVALGKFSAAAARRAQALRAGLPLSAIASGARDADNDIALLAQRLARLGLLEFRLGRSSRGADQVIMNRRFRITGHEHRISMRPTFWCCRDLPICADAGATWCWSRHFRAHCSEFAITTLRPRWPCWLPRNSSKSSVDRAVLWE